MDSIGLIGGGPAALLLFKKLTENLSPCRVTIFESSSRLGCGMPYGSRGASLEHVANVSSDELPPFETSLKEWVQSLPKDKLKTYSIDKDDFHEKEVVPRLLLGDFLEATFHSQIEKARANGFEVDVLLDTRVTGLTCSKTSAAVSANDQKYNLDKIVICTGHRWPHTHEGKVEGYFDSPYPPAKLAKRFNHTVALRGSSLTAVDAIRTMARHNGQFLQKDDELIYQINEDSPDFMIEMHSKQGFLPCLRVHMDEPYVKKDQILPREEIEKNIEDNDGFLELDFLFEKGFKLPLKESDPKFFEMVKDLSLEEFIDKMMSYRSKRDAFELFREEYDDSLKSIKREESVPWKEMLASLSIALNYPAKHMSAEDMLRLQKNLKPLVATVIAFIPQGSAKELLALHKAGRITLIADGENGTVTVEDGKIVYSWENSKNVYETFIDCIGQKPLEEKDFPFQDLQKQNVTSSARLRFREQAVGQEMKANGNEHVIKEGNSYFLDVPGVNISDNFQLVNRDDVASNLVFLMAVPYMGGLNPDYSGLDFCANAADLIVEYMQNESLSKTEEVSNREIRVER
ncbi:MAG: hypothetical protein C0507_12755 [Cyanobacteria bacterium PR.3.49]|nr:hypothetical protein [Cyanobacteria bacterium PR.3.49]